MIERRIARVGPPLLGGALTVVHVLHFQRMGSALGIALEVLLPLSLSVALGAVGWWYASRISPPEATRLFGWVLVGATLLAAGLSWSVAHDVIRGGHVDHLPFVLANQVTIGATVGLVVGRYDLQVRRRGAAYRETRRNLSTERDRFAALFRNLPNPSVYYVMNEGVAVVRDVNPAFEETFGVSEEHARGRPIADIVVPDEYETETSNINERACEGTTATETVRRKTVHGMREFLVTVVPLEGIDDEQTGFSISIDVTDQKRREQRLEVLNRVLRHDLRNGMNVIAGYLDVIERADPPEALERARTRAGALLTLSEKATLAESALDIDAPDRYPVDVAELVRDRAEAGSDRFPNLVVETSVPDAQVVVLGCAPLGKAIDELIGNAATYGAATVWITVERNEELVDVVIHDDGPGIPEAELDVFRKERETALEHASGVGLWLVDWIVTAVGGVVRYDVDGGTTVTLRLQRSTAADESPVSSPE